MSQFTVHTLETAPEKSKPILEKTRDKYGFLPNLIGTLGEAPAAAKGYTAVADAFAGSSLSAVEQQVVLLTASYENECHYCMAAHSTVADKADMPKDVLEALRNGSKIESDAKLEALRTVTAKIVERRGWLEGSDVKAFFDAGYTKGQLLEVIVGVAQKTISNYTNHITETPLDEAFSQQAWMPSQKRERKAA